MPFSDIWLVVRFWGTMFLIGSAAYPLTRRLFRVSGGWHDRGYFFAKAVGLAAVSWIVYIAGMAHIAPFTVPTILGAIALVFLFGVLLEQGADGYVTTGITRQVARLKRIGSRSDVWASMLLLVVEEAFFLGALLFWTWIKAHEPSIRGLEKFMDYGFMQSAFNSRFFPPSDMWYPPYPVNYYYFGHLVTALLTKLSGLDLSYTFNLMLASIFALCATMSFSIGYQLVHMSSRFVRRKKWIAVAGGMLTAFLVTLAGNMQTIYAFTRGYNGEDVKPFWELAWSWGEVWSRLPEGLQRYWYANATRFIPYTIHEFPGYSFVVSDIHGHVLSIPFVLLAIGLLIVLFGSGFSVARGRAIPWITIGFYGFLCGVLLMTNALDGPIYFGLFAILVMWVGSTYAMWSGDWWKQKAAVIVPVMVLTAGSSLPFLLHFKSFVNGIAVNCPIPQVANTKIGPLLFEGVEKCQHSPFWMMWLLWGFFWFCGIGFLLHAVWEQRYKIEKKSLWRSIVTIWGNEFTHADILLIVCGVFATALIIFPEFFYFKDIYPMHFRSNTMFKLGYQAFILLSILSGHVIVRFLFGSVSERGGVLRFRRWFLMLLLPQVFLVSVYPLFSVRSYFAGLQTYQGVFGLEWMVREHPDDYQVVEWLRALRQSGEPAVIVESDGESYSPIDENRISAFSGTPTIIGWAVHEWLWRGTYDAVAPRREDVHDIYESEDVEKTREILKKYGVRYIIVGDMERSRFPRLQEWKFMKFGKEVFRSRDTVVYERYAGF